MYRTLMENWVHTVCTVQYCTINWILYVQHCTVKLDMYTMYYTVQYLYLPVSRFYHACCLITKDLYYKSFSTNRILEMCLRVNSTTSVSQYCINVILYTRSMHQNYYTCTYVHTVCRHNTIHKYNLLYCIVNLTRTADMYIHVQYVQYDAIRKTITNNKEPAKLLASYVYPTQTSPNWNM